MVLVASFRPEGTDALPIMAVAITAGIATAPGMAMAR